MERLFRTHDIRKVNELEEMWDFQPVDKVDVFPDKYDYTLPVPGCWEIHPDFLTYRGQGVFRKIINTHEGKNVRLVFKGVSHTADVYFDGKLVAHHYNAFTPFDAVVKDVKAGEHEIVVFVDNSFSEKSTLHKINDYYSYGGITRPVTFEEINNLYIQRIYFTPFRENGKWKANISAEIQNLGEIAAKVTVKGTLGSYELNLGGLLVPEGQSMTVSKVFEFNEINTWSQEVPNLYFLNIKLYEEGVLKAVDDCIDRVGFREVMARDKKIFINDKEIFIKGYNRHEDHPDAGCAIPLQLMVKDLELMMASGTNCVRTSHYPNDERFLDLCDEKGILVWEESHARQITVEEMRNPLFPVQSEDCIREMLENHYNHPSIIIWGVLNECNGYHEESRVQHQRQIQQIKDFDKSRPITFASCNHFSDLCHDLADIVSLNVYSGWYKDDEVEKYIDDLIKWVYSAGGENKPIIISEFGGAAIYGFREATRVKWSEERQADILEECLKVYMNKEGIMGTIIWQFADCRVTEDPGYFTQRPRARNNKGIFDDFRRPKLSYEIVKKYYKAK
jgi:beta-glucuronidase